LGGTYVDPVFTTTIRRVTNEYPSVSNNFTYANPLRWSKDSQWFIHAYADNTRAMVNYLTGARKLTPNIGSDALQNSFFDPTDADRYCYFEGSSIKYVKISECTASAIGPIYTLKTFAFALDTSIMGGSHSCCALAVGKERYWLIPGTIASGGWRLWDRISDVLYTGSIAVDPGASGSYGTITPDAKFIIMFGPGGKVRYPVDHVGKTIPSTGTVFYNDANSGGDHGCFVSHSNGFNYFCRVNSNYNPVRLEAMRIEGLNQAEFTFNVPAGLGCPYDHNDTAPGQGSGSNYAILTCVVSGNQDNCNDGKGATNPTSGWQLFKQEIFAWNFSAGTFIRFAHHRSRETFFYPQSPKPSISMDGTRVLFASNYGGAAPGAQYADLYTFDTGFGASGDTTPPAAPLNLRII